MADFQTLMTKGRTLLDAHGLHDWGFDIQNLANPFMFPNVGVDGYLGYCDFAGKRILVDDRCQRRNQFKQTVLHEIAHAKRGEPGHDQEWVRIADGLGCSLYQMFPYHYALSHGATI